jgi:hypothetical protein
MMRSTHERRQPFHWQHLLGAVLGLGVGVSMAADQTILGGTLNVKNPGGIAAKRSIRIYARETGSPDILIGNPTDTAGAGGAVLEIFLEGASSSNQMFVLAQGSSSQGVPFWSVASTGYRYKDPRGEQGAVTSVRIKRSPAGSFVVAVQLRGANGPINVVPPNPGTSGCVALRFGTTPGFGDRYDMAFGAESRITNAGPALFRARKPTHEGLCPGAGPTTTTATVFPTTSTTTTSTTLPG